MADAAPDLGSLRAYVEDVANWVLGDAEGEQLSPERRAALSTELAAILPSGMAPAMSADIAKNTQKAIADAQDGPVAFDYQGRLTVAGLAVPDLVCLLDAVGQLIDHGVGDSMGLLHESHRRVLFAAYDLWTAKQTPPTS
jgi:hypothetical protein